MTTRIPVVPLFIALCGAARAAEPSLPPRLAQAVLLAGQERRQAEAKAEVAASSPTLRVAANAALARAKAWESALKEASSAARAQDADLLVAKAGGSAQLLRGGESLPLKPGVLLREADQLTTTAEEVELRFHDGSLLALGPESSLRVLQAPRAFPQQSTFTLERGRLYWRAPAEALAGLARVLTARAAAQLRGGRAELAVDAAGEARLAVYEGSVDLSAKPGASGPASAWWDQIELDSK